MKSVLGLDIGGANLKAATADRRARSVPFALWKHSDKLPAALATLVADFADCDEIAVTMTGELCDCFETKRDGVNCILNAVSNVSRSRPVWVWGTDGGWRHTEAARKEYMVVASANWHATATYASGFVLEGGGLLIDIGSTTTDVIGLIDGLPVPIGRTDPDRLESAELCYTGVVRTPLCALLGGTGAAEFFATTQDVYILLGKLPENPNDTSTADNRPATKRYAHARLARMWCGDSEWINEEEILRRAESVAAKQLDLIRYSVRTVAHRVRAQLPPDERYRKLLPASVLIGRDIFDCGQPLSIILAGSGEFLARSVVESLGLEVNEYISLEERLGPELSACAPAYAVAKLLAERRP